MNTFHFWELFLFGSLGGVPECSRKEELTVPEDSHYLLSTPFHVYLLS